MPDNGELSRQQKRHNQRKLEKQQTQLSKGLTRGEGLQLIINHINAAIENYDKIIKARFQGVYINQMALRRRLIKSGIITEKGLLEDVEFEKGRLDILQKIQASSESYDKLFEKCKKWELDIAQTGLIKRIKEDKKLSSEEKNKLAETWGFSKEALLDDVKT